VEGIKQHNARILEHLVLIHGSQDTVVPYSHSADIYHAMSNFVGNHSNEASSPLDMKQQKRFRLEKPNDIDHQKHNSSSTYSPKRSRFEDTNSSPASSQHPEKNTKMYLEQRVAKSPPTQPRTSSRRLSLRRMSSPKVVSLPPAQRPEISLYKIDKCDHNDICISMEPLRICFHHLSRRPVPFSPVLSSIGSKTKKM